jgi:hypothetical protein
LVCVVVGAPGPVHADSAGLLVAIDMTLNSAGAQTEASSAAFDDVAARIGKRTPARYARDLTSILNLPHAWNETPQRRFK